MRAQRINVSLSSWFLCRSDMSGMSGVLGLSWIISGEQTMGAFSPSSAMLCALKPRVLVESSLTPPSFACSSLRPSKPSPALCCDMVPRTTLSSLCRTQYKAYSLLDYPASRGSTRTRRSVPEVPQRCARIRGSSPPRPAPPSRHGLTPHAPDTRPGSPAPLPISQHRCQHSSPQAYSRAGSSLP